MNSEKGRKVAARGSEGSMGAIESHIPDSWCELIARKGISSRSKIRASIRVPYIDILADRVPF